MIPINATYNPRRTAHQMYLPQITWIRAPEKSDIGTITLLLRRLPGTMVSENHISSSNLGRDKISFWSKS